MLEKYKNKTDNFTHAQVNVTNFIFSLVARQTNAAKQVKLFQVGIKSNQTNQSNSNLTVHNNNDEDSEPGRLPVQKRLGNV